MSSSEALARRSPVTGLLDRRWSAPARIVAALLAHRLGGGRAAVFALPLATTVPALVKEGLSADSTVPYAACAVGAAAIGAGRPAASAMLGVGGFLRPEAWGLAAVSAALGWR